MRKFARTEHKGGESTEKNHKLFVAYFRWAIRKERREHGLSDDLGELVREYEEILPEYAEKLKWLIGFSEEERQEDGGGEKMGVAENIQRLIKQKGLVQKAVATRAGFTATQFADMMHGRKTIKADYIPAIAEAIGVSAGELFEEN